MKGQSLGNIATIYNIKVNDLLVENPDAIDTIMVGQELKIPFQNPEGTSETSENLIPNKNTKATESLPKLTVSGYVDAYFAYYADSVGIGKFQKFPSIAPRNGFGLNTAVLSVKYTDIKAHGIITLHYGDIAKSAWSSTFNNIMEANAGFRICKKVWIDAGFFRTHIGAEGLLPKENFTSSVSVGTFYETYYESGLRLKFDPTDRLAINLFILNGYGMYEDNNSKKSVGILVTDSIGKKGNIGYSNYIGDDTPDAADSISHLRIYQAFFFNYVIGKLKLQLGFDYAVQENSDISDKKEQASMYSGVLAMKYQMKEKFSIYSRAEIFNDPQGFMSGVFTDKKDKLTGQKLWGATFGLEYKPTEKTYVRLEGRRLQMDADQKIFRENGKDSDNRFETIFNIGISF